MSCGGARTTQNVFFDAETMEPLIHNDGFRAATELHQRLLRSSNCPDQLAPTGSNP